MVFKFGTPCGDDNSEFEYGNIFQIERHPTWSRVAIGANDGQIALMLDVAKSWPGPHGVLYVLVAPRLGHDPGRYQNAAPCASKDLEQFACTFQEYFEQDARHHLWFMDLPSGSQLVYDNHDIIYGYGDIDWYAGFLSRRGFAEKPLRIPVPHTHCFNREFDHCEDAVLHHWGWKRFPLQEQHDDP